MSGTSKRNILKLLTIYVIFEENNIPYVNGNLPKDIMMKLLGISENEYINMTMS